MEHLPVPRTLLSGLTMVEAARWHEDRLWFAHWGSEEIVAVDMDGRAEVMAPGAPGMGWAFDWLPDGDLLHTGPSLVRQRPDGTRATLHDGPGGEIVVDARGHVFVNHINFDFRGGGAPQSGWIDLVHDDGSTQRLVSDLQFPNGMAVTPDGSTLIVSESFTGRLVAFDIEPDGSLTRRRTWADGLGPDGICVDAESAVWVQAGDTYAHSGNPEAPAGACVRVLEGGEVTHRIETELPCFACALGGPDGRSLFLLCNEFESVDRMAEILARRSARILVTDAPVSLAD